MGALTVWFHEAFRFRWDSCGHHNSAPEFERAGETSHHSFWRTEISEIHFSPKMAIFTGARPSAQNPSEMNIFLHSTDYSEQLSIRASRLHELGDRRGPADIPAPPADGLTLPADNECRMWRAGFVILRVISAPSAGKLRFYSQNRNIHIYYSRRKGV